MSNNTEKSLMKAALFSDEDLRDKVYRSLLQVFVVTYLVLQREATNIVVSLLAIYWMTQPGFFGKFAGMLRNKLFWAVTSLFLIYVVGVLYSAHWLDAIRRLETRSALFVFPVLFSTMALSRKTVLTVLRTFIWMAFAVGLVGLIHSSWLYQTTGDPGYFYNDNLLMLIHGQAVYFGLYLNVAIVFMIYLAASHEAGRAESRLFTLMVFPLFLVLIFLLASRVSLALLVLLVGIVILVVIIRNKRYGLGIGLAVVVVIGSVLLAHFFPRTMTRFRSLTSFHFDYQDEREVFHFNETDYENRWNGLTIRLAIWSCTWDVIKEHPWVGTGTGDYMPAIRERYREKDFRLGIKRAFNPHNEYLAVWVALGLVGLGVFLFSLLYPAWVARRNGNWLYLAFLLIVCLNMFTEEILAVYRGTVFFGFLNSLLLFHLTDYRHDTS